MGRRNLDVEAIVRRDGIRCHYCKQFMNIYPKPTAAQVKDPMRFTFEHIVPRSKGGTYAHYNIVGACSTCNQIQGSDDLKCFCNFCQKARARNELREVLSAVGRVA